MAKSSTAPHEYCFNTSRPRSTRVQSSAGLGVLVALVGRLLPCQRPQRG